MCQTTADEILSQDETFGSFAFLGIFQVEKIQMKWETFEMWLIQESTFYCWKKEKKKKIKSFQSAMIICTPQKHSKITGFSYWALSKEKCCIHNRGFFDQ